MMSVVLQGIEIKKQLKALNIDITHVVCDFVGFDIALIDLNYTLPKLTHFQLERQSICPLAQAELSILNEYGQIEW